MENKELEYEEKSFNDAIDNIYKKCIEDKDYNDSLLNKQKCVITKNDVNVLMNNVKEKKHYYINPSKREKMLIKTLLKLRRKDYINITESKKEEHDRKIAFLEVYLKDKFRVYELSDEQFIKLIEYTKYHKMYYRIINLFERVYNELIRYIKHGKQDRKRDNN